MSSTYDYLMSLIKGPETQAGNLPASSNSTFTYLKSLIRPDADDIFKPKAPPAPQPAPVAMNPIQEANLQAASLGLPFTFTDKSLEQWDNVPDPTPSTPPAEQNDPLQDIHEKRLEQLDNRGNTTVPNTPTGTPRYVNPTSIQYGDRVSEAAVGLPFMPPTEEDVKALTDEIETLNLKRSQIDTLDQAPETQNAIDILTQRRNDMRASLDQAKKNLMAQPAAWTDSEKQAKELKQKDRWAYEDFITTDAYINGNWSKWLALAGKKGVLSTDERAQAKMAADALGKVAERLWLSCGGDLSKLTDDDVKRYNTLTGLSGMLESKYSGVEAAVLGAANVLPVEKISSQLRGIPAFAAWQDSRYSDPEVAKLLSNNSMTENAKAANPGIYTASNIAANAVATAAGGAGLELAGVASPIARDVILSGLQSGINSAADQDWSKPWEALGKTALDTTLGAAGSAATGWLTKTLPKAIADEWYGSNNVPKNLKWPETMDELDALNARLKSGDVPNDTQLKLEPGAGQGYNGKELEDYLKYLMDSREQVLKSGGTARDFTDMMGVPRTLTGEEITSLDKYSDLRMHSNNLDDLGKPSEPDEFAKAVDDWNEGSTTEKNTSDNLQVRNKYTGQLLKVSKQDAAADALTGRIGGESRVRFSDDPMGREFDNVSPEYVGQTKPALQGLNKRTRNQMKATFEAAKETGRKVYYHFDGQPAKVVTDKLLEYSKRYGIEVVIDTRPLT